MRRGYRVDDEGRRVPVYVDIGPARAYGGDALGISNMPVRELESPGAAPVERRSAWDAEPERQDAWAAIAEAAKPVRPHAPPTESYRRGGEVNRARVAALHAAPSPVTEKEPSAMAIAEPPPIAVPAVLPVTPFRAAAAMCADCVKADVCRIRPELELLEVTPPSVPKGITVQVELEVACEYFVAIGAPPATVVIPMRDPAPQHVPTVEQARSQRAVVPGLTPRQVEVLEAMTRLGGDRSAVAREFNVQYQSVDAVLDAIDRKGLLPADLRALLPARFHRQERVG